MNKSELVQMVVERAGISAPQAEKAIDVVLAQLQAHLPGPIASQVQNLVGTEATPGGGGIAAGIGNILKGK